MASRFPTRTVRPPVPDDVPAEGRTFKGTNPWSGPYAVISIIIGAIIAIGGIIAAVFFGLEAY